MARTGFDAWIVDAREYNEDPVIMTLLPDPAMAARRRAILLFCRRAVGSVERLTLDRYGYADFYARGWDPDIGEDQYACLARLLRERSPQRIGINISVDFAFGMASLCSIAKSSRFVLPQASALPARGWEIGKIPPTPISQLPMDGTIVDDG